jgi:hypothetical protein
MAWSKSSQNGRGSPAITPLPPVVPTAAERAANEQLAVMTAGIRPSEVQPDPQIPISATSVKTNIGH